MGDAAPGSRLVLIFQDTADGDNFVSVADLLRQQVEGTCVALVVTGRHADLSHAFREGAAALPPAQRLLWLSEQPPEDAAAVAHDSRLVLRDGARRMAAFLRALGLWSHVTHFVVDEALIPPKPSPRSHRAHMLEYLFDRADLFGGRLGDCPSAEEYIAKVRELAALPSDDARRAACRALIAGAPLSAHDAGAPLASLLDALAAQRFASACAYVMGPLTAVARVLREVRCDARLEITGQLFAYNNLSSKSSTMLANSFNVDCDTGAAEDFLAYLAERGAAARASYFPSEAARANAPQRALEAALMAEHLRKSPQERHDYPAMQLWAMGCVAYSMVPLTPATPPDMLVDLAVSMCAGASAEDAQRYAWRPVSITPRLLADCGAQRVLAAHPTYLAGRVAFQMEVVAGAEARETNQRAVACDDFGWCTRDWEARFRSLLAMRRVRPYADAPAEAGCLLTDGD